MARTESYFDVLTLAVNDLSDHGYDDPSRVLYWTERLRKAADAGTTSPEIMERMLREAMASTYRNLIDADRSSTAITSAPRASRWRRSGRSCAPNWTVGFSPPQT